MGLTTLASRNLLAGACLGAGVYIGREYTQWETLHRIDWPGLISPVIAVTLVYLIAQAI